MKVVIFFLLLISSSVHACVDFSGKYGEDGGKNFYEEIEQRGCEEITFIWVQNGQELLRVTKKTNGFMSSNDPVQNEYALIRHEADHFYYVTVDTKREGFTEGTEYKMPNGDRKRTSKRYSKEGLSEYVDILPLIN